MQISNFNSSAMQALRILSSINTDMTRTEQRMATGQRINSAADNASHWSIATTMRSEVASRRAMADSMSMSLNVVDAAVQGVDTTLTLLNRFKQLMVQAADPNANATAIDTEMRSIRDQLVSTVKSASFNGINLLYHKRGASYNFNYTGGADISGSGTVMPAQRTLDLTRLTLFDEVAGNGWLTRAFSQPGANTFRQLLPLQPSNFLIGVYFTGTTRATGFAYNTALWALDQVITGVTNTSATLGALKAGLEGQVELTNRIADIQERGIRRLVNADMNEESARLKALQARQQLGIQALSMANDRPNAILQLFRQDSGTSLYRWR